MTEQRLGILAGGGGLPREIAESAAARGLPVSIVAIEGEADADFGSHKVTVVNWGQIGAMVRALKQERVTDLVIVGRVHRPELGRLKPDLGFFRYLPKILKIVAAGGDDSVLRRVVRFFEDQGLTVICPGDAAPALVVGEGPMGAEAASSADRADIAKGLELVRTLGRFDIGQGVIVSNGRIETIEGAEGTDRMLARAAKQRRISDQGAQGGVLVKRTKPGQDIRVDMPTIGPATVEGAREAALSGIAVEAGCVLVADRSLTLSRADTSHVFIEGVSDGAEQDAQPRFNARKSTMAFRILTRETPDQHVTHDAIKAVATLDAVAPFAVGDAVVVVRNHVLSVEAGGEGANAAIARAMELRQWASLTRRRRGVAGLARDEDLTRTVIESVAKAGYAGVVLAGAHRQGRADMKDLIRMADEQGIVILERAGEAGATS